MRRNPFEKYLSPEDHLQVQVVTYLRQKYPEAVFFHPLNAGKRTIFEQYKAKVLGISSGVPDIMIFNNGGLAIELKIGKNKPTENQLKWQKDLIYCGWPSLVCYDFISSKNAIDQLFHK